MDVKTYRAGSLQAALDRVREELGPDAAVLQTREVRSGWLGLGRREIEVVASADVFVPSRLPPRDDEAESRQDGVEFGARRRSATSATAADVPAPPPLVEDPRAAFRASLRRWTDEPAWFAETHGELDAAHDAEQTRAIEEEATSLPTGGERARREAALGEAAALVAELTAAEFPLDAARRLVDDARRALPAGADRAALREELVRRAADELIVTGPIPVRAGARRVVALIGPTGVGKTTTIAKLAAHYRLREQRSVGLVTVDTYRIAAVEQLRTYAEILDLPLEVVASPKEMATALRRLAGCELVLVDTAGRGPRDDVRLHELRAYLHEARADEVHLVLACGASPRQLELARERFAVAGPTALLLTKLDEAASLGGLARLLLEERAPVSYLATGQNVPQDLEAAESEKLARRLLEHA